MTNDVVIATALRQTITSINRTQEAIDRTSLRLATGRRVNSAIDNPQNFFTARALNARASDLTRLLDGIGQSIYAIQEANAGVEAVSKLLLSAEAVAVKSQDAYKAGEVDGAIKTRTVNVSPQPLSSQIQGLNPAVYYRLNETAGPIVDYGVGAGGPVVATYFGGAAANAAPLYTNGPAPSVNFDGINDRINVADSNLINLSNVTARTVELVFNADTTAGRQVLYEEGAAVNGFTIYIDAGLIRVTGEDDGDWIDADISAPIVAGQTYHIAFVYSAAADRFTGYLNGVEIGFVTTASRPSFPSHSGNIGIGAAPDGVQFHDGESGGGGFNFDGRISDVAIYNTALTAPTLLSHANSLIATTTDILYNEDFEKIVNDINRIVIDANYRGINLLQGENLTTNFNESFTSLLITEGADLSFSGLGIVDHGFDTIDNIQLTINDIRKALNFVRSYATTLANDLSVVTTRQDFTRNLINILKAGGDDITIADLNEEGANLLASQTRQSIAFEALSFASQAQASILSLFASN